MLSMTRLAVMSQSALRLASAERAWLACMVHLTCHDPYTASLLFCLGFLCWYVYWKRHLLHCLRATLWWWLSGCRSTWLTEQAWLQVGAGEVTGNPLFQAFDEAIRGCALGETTVLEAKGGDWQRELFFEVHP